jgi:trans-2,3-dihydro-3-hydroxyanthranilate isomerase
MNGGCHDGGDVALAVPSGSMSELASMRQDDQVSVRVVRVFTRDGTGGNHLGIHEGHLSAQEMQVLATALGYPETIFLGEPDDDGAVPVRIFTPGSELPFAGHPLVGATWHLAAAGADTSLRCGIGVVMGRRRLDDDAAEIEMSQLPDVERRDAAGAVATWVARMPLPYEIVQLPDPAAVSGYALMDRPDHRLIWAFGDGGRDDVVRARFFAPGLGVDEDPATGSAAVALAAVLRHEGQHTGTLTVHQGEEIGAPSRIELAWTAGDTVIGGSVADDGMRTVSVRPGS